ncbi:molybdopterin-dependent oxidoreductase [Humitalea sp. 24SJ18S-53]|uniref:molybdopterin-dependent oxidoreductase n=1 Tax=Humitalea sp. 24SJ18S-53 TaxID=3422307 RepID=UPI003D67990D
MRIIPRRTLMTTFGAATLGLATAAATSGGAVAQGTLQRPTGRAILRVRGDIANTNDGDVAVFDRAMLAAIGSATITTSTPWYDTPVRFDGVPMAKLMEAVGARGQTLTAIALNDYSTDIPIADFSRFGVILATHRNGAEMPVSDRGPLFIVYPYDSDAELRNRLYYSRSAWSVAQLIVR